MRPIRAGVLGTGFMGGAHVDALRRLPGVEVVAICGSSEARARRAAAAWGVPRAYGDPHALVKDPEVDVVHNCTPNFLHFSLTQAALLAGKHVLCEKPLAMDSQEASVLTDLAERQGVVAAVNFAYRYYPMVQQARAMVHDDNLGRIFLVHGAYLQDWLLYQHDYNWRVEPERGGRYRALADIGSHWCDLAQHVTGRRITHVCADLAVVHRTRFRPAGEAHTFGSGERGGTEVPVQTEDYAAVLLRFDNGVRGVFTVSQVSAGHKNGLVLEVDCADGAVRWDQEASNELWIGRRGRPNEVLAKDPSLLDDAARSYARYPGGHPEGYPDGFRNLFANVYAHIADRSGRPEIPSFREAYEVARLVEAIGQSFTDGQWVEVT